MSKTSLSLIAAVARDGAIGRGNELLWRESADQKHFRAVTMACPVIMGRRTWDSLPERFRPLPGRRNIVVTRDPGFRSAVAAFATDAVVQLKTRAALRRSSVVGVAVETQLRLVRRSNAEPARHGL